MQNLRCEFEEVGAKAVCKHCQRSLARWAGKAADIVAPCRPGSTIPRKPVDILWKLHRPRTEEEYASVTAICYACDHYQPDPGICGLKSKGGCGACKDGATFTKFKMSGAACPAKPPRFDGTPLVE